MVAALHHYRNSAGLAHVGGILQPGEAILAGEIPMAALTEADRLRLLAYPASLARRVRESDPSARLRVVFVVPDWDTDGMTADPRRPFNLTPHGRTYACQPDPESCDESRAQHWEALFEAHTQELRDAAHAANVEVTHASALVREPGFHSMLRLALRSPSQIAEAIRETMQGVEIGEAPLAFAGAACRVCGAMQGTTEYDADWDRAQFHCAECDNRQEADIREQPMWMQEDVLRAAVIAALRPALVIRRPGRKWDAREALIDSLLLLAVGEGAQPPTRLAPPSLDSEQGGTPLPDLIGMAEEWEEDFAELP